MILTAGERSVWAAAFVTVLMSRARASAEEMALSIEERRPFDPEKVMTPAEIDRAAARAAGSAVRHMREVCLGGDSAGEHDEEDNQMLRAMLGDEG